MGDHYSVEVDDVVKNTVKSQEWRNGASKNTPGAKNTKKIFQYADSELGSYLSLLDAMLGTPPLTNPALPLAQPRYHPAHPHFRIMDKR